MYYQNYEDYMRAVLGYPIDTTNTYSRYNSSNYLQFNNTNLAIQDVPKESSYMAISEKENEFLDLYPDIYKIVNPMVCKICENNRAPVTRELVQKMTDEIYNNLEETETPTVVNINATLTNNTTINSERTQNRDYRTPQSTPQNSTQKNSNLNNREYKEVRNNKENAIQKDARDNKKSGEVRETRQIIPRNNLLRDLIQILILKRLLEGNRPPVNNPPRPPINPGPPRPPIRPREYTDYYKF